MVVAYWQVTKVESSGSNTPQQRSTRHKRLIYRANVETSSRKMRILSAHRLPQTSLMKKTNKKKTTAEARRKKSYRLHPVNSPEMSRIRTAVMSRATVVAHEVATLHSRGRQTLPAAMKTTQRMAGLLEDHWPTNLGMARRRSCRTTWSASKSVSEAVRHTSRETSSWSSSPLQSLRRK